MIRIINKSDCCGCEACVQVCPKQCIAFQEDKEGFYYPLVDANVCINCNLCEKVCPVQNQVEEKKPLNAYAGKNKNEEELMTSSSGGIFILLARIVIKDGGVVFGARFDKDWKVVHAYAETEEDVKAFMGSKYVQSRIGNTFREAKVFLDAGRQVLFSGTSCQIAGLKRFLHKDYDNLLTVDVICHGVPSPKVWRMYLDEVKRNARQGENSVSLPLTHIIPKGNAFVGGSQIKSISFRDKRLGWKKFSFALTLSGASADGKQNTVTLSHIHKEDPFMILFLKNVILRPSCHQCPAKGGKSQSDITIADFWGIEKVNPTIDDDRGVGLVIVNTIKGANVVKLLDFQCYEVLFKDAIAGNMSYFYSATPNQVRNYFFEQIDVKNDIIPQTARKLNIPIYRRIVKKIFCVIKRLFVDSCFW